MKKCPFCAEEVQDDAVKCKHCHSDLNVHKSPAAVVKPKNGVQPAWYLLAMGYVLVFFIFYVIAVVEGYSWAALIIGLVGVWLFPSAVQNKPVGERLRQWKQYWQRSALSALLLFLAIGTQAMFIAVKIDNARLAEQERQEALDPRPTGTQLEIKPSYTLNSAIEATHFVSAEIDSSISTYDATTGQQEVKVVVDLDRYATNSMLLPQTYSIMKVVADAGLEDSIDRVTIMFHKDLVDIYGNTESIQVMYVRFMRSTWEKIDWENVLIDNIPKIADVYTVHDAVR